MPPDPPRVRVLMHTYSSLIPRPLPDFILQPWRKIWEWPGDEATRTLGLRPPLDQFLNEGLGVTNLFIKITHSLKKSPRLYI